MIAQHGCGRRLWPPRLMISRCILPLLMTLPALGGEPVEFNRDIRPILTKHCTACHGGVKAAGGISFIFRDKALSEGESGNLAIVPGKPSQSEILKRIRSKDPDEVMPQPKHGPPLPEAEIALIERWIAEGAEWQDHWAFVPPVETPVKEISDEKWPAVALDRFVMQRLDREKLKPTPEASPEEWLRRASFDLTGLPPTPDELTSLRSAMANDPAAARAAAVDRLLASPSFGERWAAVWLDLARYSDTYGFEKDPHRDIWPFRDWVIRAFNADMPYDQFTIEQLAGDLLPNATADQRLATAFHRNTQTNTEGGTDDEEFRVAAVIDRVGTTWTTWQATTFACVQCHAHPYDPIEHEEFYQFYAFFDNTEDCDQDDDFPKMKVSAEASELEIRMRVLREQLNAAGRDLAETGGWEPFTPDEFAPSHGKLTLASDGVIRSEGTLPRGATHKVSGVAAGFSALRLEIFPDSEDPRKWPERGSFVSEFQVNLIHEGKSQPVEMKEVFSDYLAGPHDPTPRGNVGGFPKLEGPRWFVFVPTDRVDPPPGARLEISMKQNGQTAGNQATPVRNFSFQVSARPEWTALANDPGRLAMWNTRREMAEKHKAIQGPLVPVMVEREARETRFFAGGNRLTKGEVIKPGVPQLLAGSAPAEGMTRLDMARWIASRENPLTARVMVNRLWGELFGLGLVVTMEDFGSSGVLPTHPELLDHLALRFQDHHQWSVKAMLREMVLSATYLQSHRASPELVLKDPENKLLARGPRNRLSAEMVRDQALAVAGLLSPKMHGPPVYPPQPAGVWSSVYSGATWNESKGEDRFRRGIYTYLKRTSGFPGFLTFDAPSRDLCSARRIVSNTPLQALVTLNDPAHIEAAQGFAKRMSAHSPGLESQLEFGMRLATQQSATPEMIAELASLHADATAEYEKSPAESAKLADTPAAAALVLVANTILNLDSALTR
jgi:hypothetical protein